MQQTELEAAYASVIRKQHSYTKTMISTDLLSPDSGTVTNYMYIHSLFSIPNIETRLLNRTGQKILEVANSNQFWTAKQCQQFTTLFLRYVQK